MTFASDQLARIEALLAANPGVELITVGNTTVKYSDLMKQRKELMAEVARESGTKPRAAQINLGNF